jgi:hypothetical protein
MKGAPAPVLHWPKLFEGQVGLHTNKCVSGMGTGRDCWPDGLGDGYSYNGNGDEKVGTSSIMTPNPRGRRRLPLNPRG